MKNKRKPKSKDEIQKRNKEVVERLLKASNEIHKRNLNNSNQLIVSQKWIDETCKNWDCTEDELRDMFSGKTEFPK